MKTNFGNKGAAALAENKTLTTLFFDENNVGADFTTLLNMVIAANNKMVGIRADLTSLAGALDLNPPALRMIEQVVYKGLVDHAEVLGARAK